MYVVSSMAVDSSRLTDASNALLTYSTRTLTFFSTGSVLSSSTIPLWLPSTV
jgi:hypothetical protein